MCKVTVELVWKPFEYANPLHCSFVLTGFDFQLGSVSFGPDLWGYFIPDRENSIEVCCGGFNSAEDAKAALVKAVTKTELNLSEEKYTIATDNRPINTTDIPEAPEAHWAHARRFYRPRKQAVSIRLDADILDWLRGTSDRYQSKINDILRTYMDLNIKG